MIIIIYYISPSQLECAPAPYLHFKRANLALNMVFFFYALVLMLLSEFIPKRNIRRCSSCIFFFNYDAELAPNIMQICRIRIPASQVFFSDLQEIQIKDSFLYSLYVYQYRFVFSHRKFFCLQITFKTSIKGFLNLNFPV